MDWISDAGSSREVAQEWGLGNEQRLGGRDMEGMSWGTPKMCPGGETGPTRTEGVYWRGARCEAAEVSETHVWVL